MEDRHKKARKLSAVVKLSQLSEKLKKILTDEYI
jgi:hypothetical protein